VSAGVDYEIGLFGTDRLEFGEQQFLQSHEIALNHVTDRVFLNVNFCVLFGK